MPLSGDLSQKSIHAAVAAIEIYNKPNFCYREESFALLLTNAWELLLKAKWVLDHAEAADSLHELVDDGRGGQTPKLNRSGNHQSHSLPYLAKKLVEDVDSGLEQGCYDNILALMEIRDNAAHFLNKDLYLGRRVQEVGTASLRNYLQLATEWFQIDLSIYNFFLMPISFYHGFEAAEAIVPAGYPEQIQRLLRYLDTLEARDTDVKATQHVALRLETKLVRGKDSASVAFRWTDDPSAPAVSVREEDILKAYPLTYRQLTDTLKRRYDNFLENEEYHALRKTFQQERKYSIERLLNPGSPRTARTRFFNANILQEFDHHYTRRKKPRAADQQKADSMVAG